MRAITIRQPWASLIAAGVKTIETRSWSTKYRGPLAIHAGKHNDGSFFPCAYINGTVFDHPRVVNRRTLRLPSGVEVPHPGIESWPRGAVVATCTLTDVIPTESIAWATDRTFGMHRGWSLNERGWVEALVDDEQRPFGDFTPGRYAWLLTDITPCDPAPAKGRQGLWDWTP